MKIFFAAVIFIMVSGCGKPQIDPPGATQVSGRYQVFEVKEHGLICVSGGSGQLSCVKK